MDFSCDVGILHERASQLTIRRTDSSVLRGVFFQIIRFFRSKRLNPSDSLNVLIVFLLTAVELRVKDLGPAQSPPFLHTRLLPRVL